MINPLPHQVDGLRHLVDVLSKHSHCLEASSTGWGKTYVSLMACRELGLRPAIVCRKTMINTWTEVSRKIGLEPVFVSNIEACKSKKFEHGGWAVKNKRYDWKVPKDTLMILDEAHCFKDIKSGNNKLGIATKRQNIKTLFLTATPGASPLDFYCFAKCFGFVSNPSDFYRWCMAHGVTEGGYALEFRGKPEMLAKYMGEIGDKIFPEYGHRVLWKDVPDFPETITNTVSVVGSRKSELQHLYEELFAKMDEDEELPIVDLLRARQLSELEKIPAMVEMADRYLGEGKSVVVFLNFDQSIEAFTDILPRQWKYDTLTGATKDRDMVVENFQENYSPLLICNLKAGGESVSLHDLKGRQRVSLISPSYSAQDLIQVLGRIHRSGSLSPAMQHLFFVKDSVEDKVRASVDQKLKNLDSLLDADLNPFV